MQLQDKFSAMAHFNLELLDYCDCPESNMVCSVAAQKDRLGKKRDALKFTSPPEKIFLFSHSNRTAMKIFLSPTMLRPGIIKMPKTHVKKIAWVHLC